MTMMSVLFILSSSSSLFALADTGAKLRRAQKPVSVSSLKTDYASFASTIVRPICIKRVSGTPGNLQVREFIASQMRAHGWHVAIDSFSDRTPRGTKQFANVIATLPVGRSLSETKGAEAQAGGAKPGHDEPAAFVLNNRIVLACHYDSKQFDAIRDFVAATDSAVPCAMLVELARHLSAKFPNARADFAHLMRHVQFIFFDGEEAFDSWSATDSIYGARHYADRLEARHGAQAFKSIELFVLLDLLGGDSTSFLNHFPAETGHIYNMMSNIENMLGRKGALHTRKKTFFADKWGRGQNTRIEDDHMPFLKKGVPVLHMIPVPFPHQWHSAQDTLANVNSKNVEDLLMILKVFLLSC